MYLLSLVLHLNISRQGAFCPTILQISQKNFFIACVAPEIDAFWRPKDRSAPALPCETVAIAARSCAADSGARNTRRTISAPARRASRTHRPRLAGCRPTSRPRMRVARGCNGAQCVPPPRSTMPVYPAARRSYRSARRTRHTLRLRRRPYPRGRSAVAPHINRLRDKCCRTTAPKPIRRLCESRRPNETVRLRGCSRAANGQSSTTFPNKSERKNSSSVIPNASHSL